MIFRKKYHTQSLSIDNYSKIEYNHLEITILRCGGRCRRCQDAITLITGHTVCCLPQTTNIYADYVSRNLQRIAHRSGTPAIQTAETGTKTAKFTDIIQNIFKLRRMLAWRKRFAPYAALPRGRSARMTGYIGGIAAKDARPFLLRKRRERQC